MPESILLRQLLLPELRYQRSWRKPGTATLSVAAEKQSQLEVCPRCATPSTSTYDHRTVVVRDAPMRAFAVRLLVRKRRLSCRPCGRPFTEPVPGIIKGYRSTERYRRSLLWACENFSDLKGVRRAYHCSSGYVYKAFYKQLELEQRKRQYPWPKVIGLDEHFFRLRRGFRSFVSMVVDYSNRRLKELVEGRTIAELETQLAYIEGRENVRFVVLDLCDPYKSFAQRFFPNAQLVADKFHVLRLLTPHINRRRKLVTGDRRSALIRRLLLRSRFTLEPTARWAVDRWLADYPDLRELYEARHRGLAHGAARIAAAVDHRPGRVVSRLMWKLAMAPIPDAAFRLCSTTRYAAASSSWAMTSTIFS
jgi:transposase